MGVQLAKNGAKSIIKNLGGVGGIAAGTGNLVKMALSRGGRLFGKTFSKEVYTQIGKTFTKKMMQRLNIVLTILIEGLDFVIQANKWQNKLFSNAEKSITKWREEVEIELQSVMLSEYSIANKKLLKEIYAAFDEEINCDIEAIEKKLSINQKAELIGYIAQLNEYKIQLENYNG